MNVCCADTTPPTVTYCASSNNTNNNTLAKAGDLISVVISSNEALFVPSVVCGGITFNTITSSGSGSSSYTAQHIVSGGDVNGLASCVVSVVDLAGNTGVANKSSSAICDVTIGE